MVLDNNHIYDYLYSYLFKNNLLEEFKQIWLVSHYKRTRSLSKLWENIFKFVNSHDFESYAGGGASIEDNRNKIKGDIGELFCLAWCLSHASRIKFYGIKPTKRDAEGTDFIGKNQDNLIAILQAKTYASTTELTPEETMRFFRSAFENQVQYSPDIDNVKPYYLFIPYGKIKHEWGYKKSTFIIDSKFINEVTEVGFWGSLEDLIKVKF
jgi:hypothetical protein